MTARATMMPTDSSAASWNRGSRENRFSRTLAPGSAPLTAVMTRTLLTADLSTPHEAAASVQASTRAWGPGAAATASGAITWNTAEAAPYDRPTAAAVNTRRCSSVARTRHCTSAIRGIGTRSA